MPHESILKPWVRELGLRHQGVLLTAVRGCDTAPKEHPTKDLTRCFREAVLRAHCGDAKKSASFIEQVDEDEFDARASIVASDLDALPHHYVMHLLHAAEIVGYYHPTHGDSARWLRFYRLACKKLHVTPETREQLDARLGANESDFGRDQ